MWICRGSYWGSLWNEWASSGDLWSDATLVGATLSRDVAGVFSAGEVDWHCGILVDGAVGACCDTLLPDMFACFAAGSLAGQSCESASAWRCLFKIRIRGARGYWGCFAGRVLAWIGEMKGMMRGFFLLLVVCALAGCKSVAPPTPLTDLNAQQTHGHAV